MGNQKGSIVFGLIIVLAVFYFFSLYLSFTGWGYASYVGGYTHAPSGWYFGGPSYYASSSVRTGSVSGPAHVGGGPRAGK